MAEVAKVEDGKCFDGEAWMWDPFYSGSCDDVEIDIAASRINAVPNTSRTTTPLVRKRSLCDTESPRKRLRLVDQVKCLPALEEETSPEIGPDDLLQLQIIALHSQQQDKQRLSTLVSNLQKDIADVRAEKQRLKIRHRRFLLEDALPRAEEAVRHAENFVVAVKHELALTNVELQDEGSWSDC